MNRAQNRRPFIAVEGPNGVGKTTLVKGLAQRYLDADIPCVPLRNPGSTALGAKVREGVVETEDKVSPDAQLLAFMAAHTELFLKKVAPAEAGSIVVVDRYKLSTVVYQGVLPQTYLPPFLSRVEEVGRYLPEPDLYIVLQATGEVLHERSQSRSEGEGASRDAFEGDCRAFQREALAWSMPRLFVPGTLMVVDTTDRSPEEVLDHVWEELGKLWPVNTGPLSDGPMLRAREALDEF